MKYSGISIFIIAISIIAWAWHSKLGAGGLQGISADGNLAVRRAHQQLSVSPAQLTELAQVEASLARLNKLHYPLDRDYPFIAVEEPRAVSQPEDSPLLKAGLDQTAHRYEVSMVFITSEARYAVIDGQFCQPGCLLPFGGRVLSINRQGVEVSQAGGIQKLVVKGANYEAGAWTTKVALLRDITGEAE